MRVSVVMRCGLLAVIAAAGGLAVAGLSVAANSGEARILAHGPWPPALAPDPSNRASGEPLAIELGRRLFFDPRMSPSGYIACVSCHQPDRAFTDAKARAHGLADLDRNTISLANVRLQQRFGWAGATRNSRAAIARSSASRRSTTTNARWSTSRRRWLPSSRRCRPGARLSTLIAMRWRAAITVPRHATQGPHSAACDSSSARQAAPDVTRGRISPTVAST
jgi:hypothetical protein